MEPATPFTVKLRGAPFNVKEVSEQELPDFRGAVKIFHFKNILYIPCVCIDDTNVFYV